MFIRVKGATPGDPLHEFDLPVVEYERRPDLYQVVDKKPVAKARPASHISGVLPERRASPAAKPKRAPKTGEDNNSAPSAGLDPKEE